MLRLFKQKLPSVRLIHSYPTFIDNWNGYGLIFQVQNGKELFDEIITSKEDGGLNCLVFDGIPLMKFHGEQYLCPTCEKLISAGYGIDKIDNSIIEQIRLATNQPFESLDISLNNLTPLLGLLKTGYYALVDSSLYPTDGDGNFFWTIDNTPKLNKASCMQYENLHTFPEIPFFVLPSQSPNFYNEATAEFYRDKPQYRALAYNMGHLNVLLDGHHKATAAALEGRKVNTLIIIPMHSYVIPSEYNNYEESIMMGGYKVSLNDIGTTLDEIKKMPKQITHTSYKFDYLSNLYESNFDGFQWTEDIISTAKEYPNIMDLAYVYWAGEITEELVKKILFDNGILDHHQMYSILISMNLSKHPDFKKVAFKIGSNREYASMWYDVYEILSRSNDEEITNYFIEYMVNDEKSYPGITKLISEYFDKLQ